MKSGRDMHLFSIAQETQPASSQIRLKHLILTKCQLKSIISEILTYHDRRKETKREI